MALAGSRAPSLRIRPSSASNLPSLVIDFSAMVGLGSEAAHSATPPLEGVVPVAPESRPAVGAFSAVVVTYNPPLEDGRLGQQIRTLAQAAALHVIVDNASSNIDEIERLVRQNNPTGSSLVIRLDHNSGLAAALNVGVRTCLAKSSADWVLLLDQDTCFFADSFQNLAEEVATLNPQILPGVIAFNCLHRRGTQALLGNQSGRAILKSTVMTSGSFVSREVLQKTQLDETLFLYYVDIDFCYRVNRAGYAVLQLYSSRIDNQEGQAVVRGGRPFFYLEPERLYYLVRDGIKVFRRYRILFDLVYPAWALCIALAVHEYPIKSVVEFSRGVIDGLRS
jgi:rhamnosyltransferase